MCEEKFKCLSNGYYRTKVELMLRVGVCLRYDTVNEGCNIDIIPSERALYLEDLATMDLTLSPQEALELYESRL